MPFSTATSSIFNVTVQPWAQGWHPAMLTCSWPDWKVTQSGSGLSTDLFTKATDTHQHLLPTSNHPPHVHRNLPYSLGLRLLTIVSDRATLQHGLEELALFLEQRGYQPALKAEQFQRVLSRSRTDPLQGRNKEKDNERVLLVCTWSSLLPPLQPLVNSALPLLQANDRLRGFFQRDLVRTQSGNPGSIASSEPTAAGS